MIDAVIEEGRLLPDNLCRDLGDGLCPLVELKYLFSDICRAPAGALQISNPSRA